MLIVDSAAFREYLCRPDSQIWEYADDGDVIVWSDTGQTLAFSGQVGQVLEHLCEEFGGLPNLTATLFLVHVLLGSRDEADLTRLGIVAASMSNEGRVEEQLEGLSARMTSLFRSLQSFPEQLGHRISPVDVANAIAALMRHARYKQLEVDEKTAESISDWMCLPGSERGLRKIFDSVKDLGSSLRDCRSAFRMLDVIASNASPISQLVASVETGVDEPVEAAEVLQDQIPDSLSQLLEQLSHDEELQAVAKAAQQIAGTLFLPRQLSDPQTLSVGGVSDITNRGNPERLLATELAADPLLLMVRIATGQALYLRRETPPSDALRTREIYIESSVRTWGQNRLKMLAVALGLAAAESGRKGCEVRVQTLFDTSLVEEDFSNREGIIEHLQRLSPAPHPGLAILSLLEEGEVEQQIDRELSQPVFIVTENTFDDEEFHSVAKQIPRPHLVAIVEQSGDVRLIERSDLGDQPLRSSEVEPIRLRTRRPQFNCEFPLFLGLSSNPLRFDAPSLQRWCAATSDGMWMQTNDERLLLFDQDGRGGREVLSRFAFQQEIAWNDDQGSLSLVVESNEVRTLVKITPEHGVQRSVAIANHLRGPMFFDEGSLFGLNLPEYHLIDQTTGLAHSKKKGVGFWSGRGPFWVHDGFLYVAMMLSGDLRTAKYPMPRGFDLTRAITVRNHRGQWVVFDRFLNHCIYADQPEVMQSLDADQATQTLGFRLLNQSSCRRRVSFISDYGGNGRMVAQVDLEKRGGKVKLINAGRSSLAVSNEPLQHYRWTGEPLVDRVTQRGIRRNFSLAGVDEIGLWLRKSARKSAVLLAFDRASSRFHLKTDFNPPPTGLQLQEFSDGIHPPLASNRMVKGSGKDHGVFKLRRLDFGDATLWMDSRGLLHFRLAGDPSELTLLLHETHCAGFFSGSANGVFGPAYFHDGGSESVPVPKDAVMWMHRWRDAAC